VIIAVLTATLLALVHLETSSAHAKNNTPAARPGRLRTDLRDGRHTTVPAGQNARNALILQAILDH
jgi:hypothetical protein